MHYYQFNIGDYKRDTSHLSLTEHGIYRQLIDLYYLTENPLSINAARLICARTDEEKQLTASILDEFFIKTDEGYIHDRCAKELCRIFKKSEKARASAKISAQVRKSNALISTEISERLTNAEQTLSERLTNAELPNTQYPIPNIKTLVPSVAGDDCPHDEIIKIYHEILPMLTQVKTWTEKRRTALKTRWREDKKRQSLDWWIKLFKYISQSDFLTGKAGNFQADLEWIINASNLVKIIEGKYENKS